MSCDPKVAKNSHVSTMKKMLRYHTMQAAFSSVNSGSISQPRAV